MPQPAPAGPAYAHQQVIIQNTAAAPATVPYTVNVVPKSRATYIILGILLGALGIHNFYAGYNGRAITQLLLCVCSGGVFALITCIWAIVEVCLVTKDAHGIQFH